jgi:hypothetical protein
MNQMQMQIQVQGLRCRMMLNRIIAHSCVFTGEELKGVGVVFRIFVFSAQLFACFII